MIINRIVSGLLIAGLVGYPTEIGYAESPSNNYTLESDTMFSKELKMVMDNLELVDEEPIEECKLTQDEINLISRVTMAEAEDEPWEGKIYVIDTILNRVDSKKFPNTVNGVIYQTSQFTSMWNGRYNRCSINHDLDNIIKEEYKSRSNSDIIFFTADQYGQYGKPSFRVGNHYFSNY